MEPKQISELFELPVKARRHLVGLLWDGISEMPEQLEVSAQLRANLEERLAEFDRNPDAVFYPVKDDSLQVLAVVHQARNSAKWPRAVHEP